MGRPRQNGAGCGDVGLKAAVRSIATTRRVEAIAEPRPLDWRPLAQPASARRLSILPRYLRIAESSTAWR
jgi:hypothetical protein